MTLLRSSQGKLNGANRFLGCLYPVWDAYIFQFPLETLSFETFFFFFNLPWGFPQVGPPGFPYGKVLTKHCSTNG